MGQNVVAQSGRKMNNFNVSHAGWSTKEYQPSMREPLVKTIGSGNQNPTRRPCKTNTDRAKMECFRHNVRKNDPSLSRAQRWMRHEGTSVQQYACNYTVKAVTKKRCVTPEFSCLQEISRLSRSVLNCLAVQKPKHSRGNIIKKHALTFLISELNWLYFTTREGRGNVHAKTAASINAEKNWFAADNRFRSTTDSSDGCHHIQLFDHWF